MPEAPDWDALYRDHIHPAFAVPQGGQDRPRCVFLTDPQGSSKTTILRRLSAELGHDVTQSIVPDALLARIDTHHADSPLRDAAVQAYRITHCATLCQWLADHAVGRRAHILWERAGPRSDAALAALLADWTALHPTIAAGDTAPPGRRTTFTPSTAICAT